MAATNVTPITRTRAAQAAADGAVAPPVPATPAGLAGAAVAVWDAVVANPGATAPVIAKAAGVTRAAAKTELTALAEAGHLTRTPGRRGDNGRTRPDAWTPAVPPAPQPGPGDATDADGGTGGRADEAGAAVPAAPPAVDAETVQNAMQIMAAEADRRAAAEAELAARVAEEEARRATVLAELSKAQTAEETRRALTDLLAAVTTAYAAVVGGDEQATAAGLERIQTEAANVRRASKATPARTGNAANGGSRNGGAGRAGRAAPRPLRPEVIAHLTAHPGKEFTPGEIGRVLDRSSGAVANALDTLVKNGEAVLTSERPARYRATTPAAVPDGPATNGAATDGPAPDGPTTGAPVAPDGPADASDRPVNGDRADAAAVAANGAATAN